MNFLFLCGCPRSGTSALAEMLVAHPDIALGMERYILRAIDVNFGLTPDLYKPERFFHVQEGDTFYNDLSFFNEYYSAIKAKYSSAKVFGDKIPPLFSHYKSLFEAFPSAKVIFILRNIYDVACSYNARAKDKNDSAWNQTWDAMYAVREWNTSIVSTLNFVKCGYSILPVVYEDIFMSDESLDYIFKFIGLSASDDLKRIITWFRKRGSELESNRDRRLTSQEKKEIFLKSEIESYRKLVELSEMSKMAH